MMRVMVDSVGRSGGHDQLSVLAPFSMGLLMRQAGQMVEVYDAALGGLSWSGVSGMFDDTTSLKGTRDDTVAASEESVATSHGGKAAGNESQVMPAAWLGLCLLGLLGLCRPLGPLVAYWSPVGPLAACRLPVWPMCRL